MENVYYYCIIKTKELVLCNASGRDVQTGKIFWDYHVVPIDTDQTPIENMVKGLINKGYL